MPRVYWPGRGVEGARANANAPQPAAPMEEEEPENEAADAVPQPPPPAPLAAPMQRVVPRRRFHRPRSPEGMTPLKGIRKQDIRRLARRGGVVRLSNMVYDETRGVLKKFLEDVIKDAVIYTAYARRKTVTAMDVVYALKRQGRTLYGFGG